MLPAHKRLLVLNGKGMKSRGQTQESREKFQSTAVYSDYRLEILRSAAQLGVEVRLAATDDKAECLALLKEASSGGADGIVINPSEWSMDEDIAMGVKDAATRVPVVEVHYSNLLKKKWSAISKHATTVICGAKIGGYRLAIQAAVAATETEFRRFDLRPKL
eukprot:TRINITY_DN2958_c4_g1_i1.p1 TRINITY_DN2958_c4_g1~~TRINITY_DN2958_c4_g1_i1.p1  ORF type:complete len:162 (+),score=35.81 TRINITY_DN2958_c4_g1_i1:89-574(+)